MFLHIGNGQTVKKKQIIGIFDLDNISLSASGREFLSREQREGNVTYYDTDLPRSFLLLEGGEVKLSRISTQGLKTRVNAPIGDLEE